MISKKIHELFPSIDAEPIHWSLESLPEKLRDKYPNYYKFKFNKEQCNELSAFCMDLNGHICGDKTVSCTNYFIDDPIIRCQPECHESVNPLDLVWCNKTNRCLLTNTFLKMFCLKPTNTSPPLNWNNIDSKCSFSEKYCKHFLLDFDEKTGLCTSGMIGDIMEKFAGEVITRNIKHGLFMDNNDIHFKCEPRRFRRDINTSKMIKYTLSKLGRNIMKPLTFASSGPIGWSLFLLDITAIILDELDLQDKKQVLDRDGLSKEIESKINNYKEVYHRFINESDYEGDKGEYLIELTPEMYIEMNFLLDPYLDEEMTNLTIQYFTINNISINDFFDNFREYPQIWPRLVFSRFNLNKLNKSHIFNTIIIIIAFISIIIYILL